MEPDAYNELSNTTYTNDEQWQKIADDFQFAYDNLPEVQIEKGRPAQAAAAAYLAKLTCIKLTARTEPIMPLPESTKKT